MPVSSTPGTDAVALCEQALALRHRDPDAALALARQALDAAGGEGAAPEAHRRALAALGACLLSFAPEVLRARELLLQALQECAAAGDEGVRCEVLNELGENYVTTSEFERGIELLQEAVALSRRLGRTGEEVKALRVLGTAWSGNGDFVQALSVLLEALKIHEASIAGRGSTATDVAELWDRGSLFARIAIVYSNLDQFQQAIAYYEVALECFTEHYPRRAARTLYSMGITAEAMQEMVLAEDCFRRSQALHRAHGDESGVALSQFGIAMALSGQGRPDEAEPLVRGAIDRLQGDPVHLAYYADALWFLGHLHIRREEFAEALGYLERALPLFVQFDRPAAHLSALHEKFSQAHRGLGNFEAALHHHERFHQLIVEHLEQQADARMSRLMVEFDTERALKDSEIARLRSVELEREIAERKEAEAELARAKARLEEVNRELHALTIRDPLTGLYNRRYLDQRFTEFFALALRRVQPLSVMICDIDDFKRINDVFSHATGDQVLRTLARIIHQHVRLSDVAARYGGEEFVVLFPAATLEQAAIAAEKLRDLVASYPWSTLHPELAVTISAGVATAEGQENHEKLLHDADRRMYQAKAAGKNRVVS